MAERTMQLTLTTAASIKAANSRYVPKLSASVRGGSVRCSAQAVVEGEANCWHPTFSASGALESRLLQ